MEGEMGKVTLTTETINEVFVRIYESKTKQAYPMVLVHGMWSDFHPLETYARFFAGKGFKVYLPSLRGRPDSRQVRDIGKVSLDDYRKDIEDITSTLEREPILVGHGMGGLIAQMVAEKNTVKQLVLLASAPPKGISLELGMGLKMRRMKYLPAMLMHNPVRLAESDYKTLFGNNVPPDERNECVDRLIPDSGRVMQEIVNEVVDIDGNRIAAPVFCIGGKNDKVITGSVVEGLRDKYGGDIALYDAFAHMLPFEEGWERVAEDILAWLKTHDHKEYEYVKTMSSSRKRAKSPKKAPAKKKTSTKDASGGKKSVSAKKTTTKKKASDTKKKITKKNTKKTTAKKKTPAKKATKKTAKKTTKKNTKKKTE